MSQGATRAAANPVCCTDDELPPPPATGALIDPAEPHPDEPGAPADSPDRLTVDAGVSN